MIAYVDASVLLRVALGQPDRLREWRQIEQGVASASIVTESLRTLDRLRLRAGLSDEDVASRRAAILDLIASLELVEVDAIVLDRAAQPMPTELGTLDAIHLATALLWKETSQAALTMATHDDALGRAARAHGLRVVGLAQRRGRHARHRATPQTLLPGERGRAPFICHPTVWVAYPLRTTIVSVPHSYVGALRHRFQAINGSTNVGRSVA